MIRPYQRYIRFLVTKGHTDYLALNETLEEFSLFPITKDDFDQQFALVHDRVPIPISNQISAQKFEGEFLKWMGVLDVKELWLYEKKYRTPESSYIKLVYDIHTDLKLRLALNALLIKGCSLQDICQSLNLKFSYMLKPEHVVIYQRFFWNIESMTRAAWKRYLSLANSAEKALLFTALTEPLDVVKTALDLPAKTSVGDTLQYLLVKANEKAKHYLQLSTPEANKEARSWISQVMTLVDKYEKHCTGDIADFSKSVQMEFEFIEEEFATPDETALAEVRLMREGAIANEEPAKD